MRGRAGRPALHHRRASAPPGDGARGAILARRDVVTCVARLAVEEDMLARVHRFLIDEIVDLFAQRRGRPVPIMAHRGHEEFLADREGRRQRVEKGGTARSEEHTSELQSLMRISYAVFCLKKKKKENKNTATTIQSKTSQTKK